MGLDLNDVSQFFLKVNENVPLSDVILTKEQEQSIHQFLRSAKNRTELRKYKIKATNTILLYGSAGGGKTFSTKAIATELGMPLYVLNVAGVLEGANPLKNIQDVFDFVRDKKNQPCILFMDECDSIVMSRNRNDIEPQMLRATNVVLQTINEENEDLNSDLTIFSATNLVHKIDEAFKSRFGLQLEFPMPQDYGEQTKMLMNGKKEFEFFNLIDDTDPNDMRIINKRAREKEFSTRELKKKILEECEELALKNIESGKPIQKLDIKLSNIMRRVARHIHSGISERLKSVDKEED